jgi:hypothetical protein
VVLDLGAFAIRVMHHPAMPAGQKATIIFVSMFVYALCPERGYEQPISICKLAYSYGR